MVSSRSRRKIVKSPSPEEDDDILSESGSDNLEVEDDIMEDADPEEDELGDDEDLALEDDIANSDEEDDELLSQEEDEESSEKSSKETPTRSTSNRRKRQAPVISSITDVFRSDEDMSETEVVPSRPLTKRQRAKLNEGGSEDYLELPMDSGKKKHLTAEEQALRRSEVARRRKNQSIQRAEKDKADTINRLLKKQASKSKRVIKDDGGEATDSTMGENGRQQSRIPDIPTKLRYVSSQSGNVLAIPESIDMKEVITPAKASALRKAIKCAIKGCGLPKKYLTSKSLTPVCSLDHYRQAEGIKQ
ncbi:unnamed protein product [Umbelopsis sp. WA50703]